ncbi:MAG: nuclear transport factor 2 family protein [Acidobacteria bacterium]|nr:nuclear transport factor 2 family protein [Acidobacteriota bacterium]
MFTRRSLLSAASAGLAAGPLAAESPEDDIRALLKNSEANWNRGDLAAFAADYEDAPTTTFVGREVTRGGTAAILARYRHSYPTAEARGTLTFSEIEVRPLCGGYALAIGRFALQRTAAGGGDAAGRFSLVLRRGAKGWKIIHDHSS